MPVLGQSGYWMKWKCESPKLEEDWSFYENRKLVDEKLEAVKNEISSRGYLTAFWVKNLENQDSLEYELIAGQKYQLIEIRKGNVPEDFAFSTSLPKEGFLDWNKWTAIVLEELENSGYPFAQVQLDSLVREGEYITASAKLDKGPFISWDSVEVAGNTKTKAQYVQQVSRLKPGEAFSQKEFEEATEALRRSPYVELSQTPDLSFQTKNARPTYFLRDRNVNLIDGVIGLLPNENEPGKVLITGQLDLELYHLGGKGRDFEVHWQRMNPETQSLAIQAKESFVFRSPLSIMGGFSLLKQDSTFISRFISLDFSYDFSKYGAIRFFTRRQASDLISTYSYREATELPEVADYRWNLYGIGIQLNRLDSPFFPRRGFFFQGEFAAGNKRIIQNTGIPEEVYANLDLNSPQITSKLELEKHLFIKQNWGMWLRGSIGLIQNKNLLQNDMFRIGGLKSIRGFNENFFFARSYGFINMEQRLFFGENSYLMAFTDFGVLENPYFAPSRDYPISFGAGVNLETGTGVFRFIYGLGKSNLQPLSFSYSKIHFGYLARF